MLKFAKDLGHIAQVLTHVVVAQHAEQGNLEHLANFLGQLNKTGIVEQVIRYLTTAGGVGQVRLEQGGFRQQRFAAGGAQVVE